MAVDSNSTGSVSSKGKCQITLLKNTQNSHCLDLNIYHHNIQGIEKKVDELNVILNSELSNVDIL